MELNQTEVQAVEQIVKEVESPLRDLNDLQLLLVGGGIGDVIVG